MADAHKAFRGITSIMLYLHSSNCERNIFRIKCLMFEDTRLYIGIYRSLYKESKTRFHHRKQSKEGKMFFHLKFRLPDNALSLLLYLDSLMIRN